ncbi:hypothetical protein BJY24_006432 [Nocardia transvalensis]|uniref:DUF6745 domain-containing protein n=1 Tax=Nocardia transvalensis TaxID=37333 RepID=A0A7W9UM84_9NOCA|nr:hypothetical protein [Nocardia transvalensis]MBB5917520.1 hypothetical protein [Nocardia transvalensis]
MLSTAPVDRSAAERAVSELYRLAGLSPPRFRWVSSPLTALCTGEPGTADRKPLRDWTVSDSPVLQRLSALCHEPWSTAATAQRLFDQWVSAPLSHTWAGCVQPVLNAAYDGSNPLARKNAASGWYSVWGHFAACRSGPSAPLWDAWEAVMRGCGAWWPGRELCVLSERPQALHAETADDLDRMRLHRDDGPAIRYADGWELYFWHGTRVPEWVITAPTAAAIDAERNIEVRRCAIEHLGWAAYLERSGMRLVGTALDPANRGFELQLYDFSSSRRVLLVTNGSVERDGTRRRYGLGVPGYLTDPVAAAAWTYGLTAQQYSLLAQRT